MIGIGVGNSAFEVGIFRKTYNILFPLFADGDLVVHQKIGEVRTPYFIGVRIDANGEHRVVYSKIGRFGDQEKLLQLMVQHAAR